MTTPPLAPGILSGTVRPARWYERIVLRRHRRSIAALTAPSTTTTIIRVRAGSAALTELLAAVCERNSVLPGLVAAAPVVTDYAAVRKARTDIESASARGFTR